MVELSWDERRPRHGRQASPMRSALQAAGQWLRASSTVHDGGNGRATTARDAERRRELSVRLRGKRTAKLPPREGMERALIAGAGGGGQLLAAELQANPTWNLWPVAFVDDDRAKIGRRVEGLPVLGDTTAIPALVHSERIDVVIVAIPSAPSSLHGRLVEIARGTSARVLTMPPLGSILRGEAQATTLKSVRPVDVLGRPVVSPDRESCRAFLRGRTVLITGAAGSIGQELALQVSQLEPEQVVLLDTNESGLHDLALDIDRTGTWTKVRTEITSVSDAEQVDAVFRRYRPNIVLHAAAYKHVPMMEAQPAQAVITNIVGTDTVARHAAAYGADRFVLVSTDKAVRPTSVMGASKRLAELAVAAVAEETGLSVCSVRFGNVLGSRGSVIPTFERQIRAGGPVTVTDPRMKRYFMTIPEAVSLIIQAGAFGDRNATYILDMGEEVPIVELAERVIALHGLRVGKDIEIVYTGIRPGEKLYEELSLDFEAAHETAHPKIRMLHGVNAEVPLCEIPEMLAGLVRFAQHGSARQVRQRVHQLVADIDGTTVPADTTGDHLVPFAPAGKAHEVATIATLAHNGHRPAGRNGAGAYASTNGD